MIQNDLFARELQLEQLAMAIARNQVGNKLPLQEVLDADLISLEFAELAFNDPLFVAKVKRYAKELLLNGFSFKEKARVIAEDGLLIAHRILHDNIVPANVRLKALENLVEWSDLSPKDIPQGGLTANAPAFSINIMLNGSGDADTRIKTVTATQTKEEKGMQLTFTSFDEDADAYENEVENK